MADGHLLQGGAEAMRLVARQVSEVIEAHGRNWRQATGTSRFDLLLMGVAMSANLAHLPYRDEGAPPVWFGIDTPDALRRPVTAMAISRSMRLPYETTRRRLRALEARGLMRIGPEGCIVPAAAPLSVDRQALAARDTALIDAAAAQLAAAGHAPSIALRAAAPVPGPVASRLLADTAARLLDCVPALYGDVIGGMVAVAMIAANVRPITADPALARRFAGEWDVPPDGLRRPIALRALSRELDLPFETVRRRASALAAAGVVEQRGDGLIVPARVLLGDAQRAASLTSALQFERLLRTLARVAEPAQGREAV